MNKTTMTLKRYSNVLQIDSEIWDKEAQKFAEMPFVIDTGASKTTIDKNTLRRAGYDVDSGKMLKISTAGGGAIVNELTLHKIRLNDLIVHDVEVYAHDFPDDVFISGLLGLNVLMQFDVNFLFSKGLIEFTEIMETQHGNN
jgi:clan AA aspartic protease (TIGR02281 family)